MAHAKPEVAGKTAKAKEHPAVTRIKKLEKRVAKLEKEKEEERRHAKANSSKEQRDFEDEERAWRIVAAKRSGLEAEVPSILVCPRPGNKPSKATPKTTKHSAQVI